MPFANSQFFRGEKLTKSGSPQRHRLKLVALDFVFDFFSQNIGQNVQQSGRLATLARSTE
jgi:hypothetical protein